MAQDKITSTQEKVIRYNARLNQKEMVNEAHLAKENGVSYGMYKAGIRKTDASEGYAIHQTDVLHRTEKDENAPKPIATIKRGVKPCKN